MLVWLHRAPVLLVAALVFAAVPARAGDLSLRAGVYTDADSAFVGFEYRTPLEGRLHLAPSFELVFPDDATYFSMNADVHYLFASRGRTEGWLGGGLGIYVWNSDGPGDDTNLGLNLIGGIGLRTDLRPYAQLKVAMHGDTELAFAFGIRF